MVLNSFDGEFLVPHAHNHTGVGPGCDFELFREGVVGPGEGVVSGYGNVLWDVTVDSAAVVFDLGGFAVDNLAGIGDVAAKDREDALSRLDWERYVKPPVEQISCGGRGTHSPIHTPSTGIFPAKCLMASLLTPASLSGCPGPGEMTSCVGFASISSCKVTLSLRCTVTLAPSRVRNW